MESEPLLTTSTESPSFQIRLARFREQASLARVGTAAFWNDPLFGDIIHPYREQYPHHPDLYWLRRIQVDWWDWGHVFLVAVEREEKTGKELVIGAAHWTRIGAKEENCNAGWGLNWWDLRNLLKPIFQLYTRFTSRIFPNRAASPAHESIIEDSYSFLADVWTGKHFPSWYLSSLAVDPAFQQRGVGRKLVQWGLDQAGKEGISASVISAIGKENFYQRCGFDVGPVGRAGAGEGNPLADVPGGLIFFREAPSQS